MMALALGGALRWIKSDRGGGRESMPDGMEPTLSNTVARWLADFESALSAGDGDAIAALFQGDGYWRDLVAFTWHIDTIRGAAEIGAAFLARAAEANAAGFEIDPDRTPPRIVTRAGTESVEAIFRFRTARGPASGVVRLIGEGVQARAWTLSTALDALSGFEEAIGDTQPTGEAYSRDFSGPNWLDQRVAAAAYEDHDPAVLVVGGGQAGLATAARLVQLGVDTLIIDREARVGDNWRKRYHALSLHNQVHVNHLPYMPFPPNWPKYIPKDKLANWFEGYAEAMELNFWTGTTFAGATWDDAEVRWTATLERDDGTVRRMRPRHIVMATGASDIPNMPDIPSLADFAGPVLHSTEYGGSQAWADKNALVLGTGTSGHDIAQDLHANGAHATLIQRNPTMVINVEPSAQMPYALYDEGPDLEDCDFVVASTPFQVVRKAHQLMTKQTTVMDKELLDALEGVGFRLEFGHDGSGWQFKFLERGGGYYFNVGCSDLMVAGEVGLVQYADIETFVSDGARMTNGETLPADLIVLATGYKGQDVLVRKLFGDAVADRVGPIWGFDSDQHELRNMYVRTPQPGLWFIAGSFAQCRIYSKFLGLQIKACEESLIPLTRPR
jgi:putative flavoprotein involved in K+ transport